MSNPFLEAERLRIAGANKLKLVAEMREGSHGILAAEDAPEVLKDFARHRLLLAAFYEEQVAHDNRWMEEAFSECPDRGKLFHPAVKDDWKEFQAECRNLERIDRKLFKQCVAAGIFEDIDDEAWEE